MSLAKPVFSLPLPQRDAWRSALRFSDLPLARHASRARRVAPPAYTGFRLKSMLTCCGFTWSFQDLGVTVPYQRSEPVRPQQFNPVAKPCTGFLSTELQRIRRVNRFSSLFELGSSRAPIRKPYCQAHALLWAYFHPRALNVSAPLLLFEARRTIRREARLIDLDHSVHAVADRFYAVERTLLLDGTGMLPSWTTSVA